MVRKMANELIKIGPDSNDWLEVQKETISQFDYEQIKIQLSSNYPKPQRHWLLLTKMLKATGAREAEIMRLTPSHIRIRGPYTHILVRRGKKQDKGRSDVYEEMPLNPEVASDLLSYIQALNIRPAEKIWPQTPRAFQIAFKKAAQAALGVDRHPHELRGLYIMDLITHLKLPIEQASVMVGHTNINTTRKHYYKLTPKEKFDINMKVQI